MGLNCSALVSQTEIPIPSAIPESVAARDSNVWNTSRGSQPDEKERAEKTAASFQKWEEALGNLKRLQCSIKITTVDMVFNERENQTGTYRFLKIKEQIETKSYRNLDLGFDRPKLSKNIKIINNKFYTINKQSKNIDIINIKDLLYPEENAKNSTFKLSWTFSNVYDSFIIVILTFKPTHILDRYLVNLAKEDDYYLYFDLHPKSGDDKSLFTRGRLVLLKSTFLPRQIWCEQPNRTEGLYEFTNMNLNPDLKVSDFAALDMGNFKGWSIQDSTRSR